ncbi:hypothetical protein C0993_011501 [Termitomyces sp. T159_Od127]|nr:hypothetical protein C0993_011501 [Termitomyces sp. T159_Od127]
MTDRIKQLLSHIPKPDFSMSAVDSSSYGSIFKLTAAYQADTFEKKINLGVGAYRDDDNKPWVLPVVQKASERILKDTSLDHEYLPITGLGSFTSAAAKLILGTASPGIQENRVVSVQTISGTGANHLGALFLSRFYKWNGSPKVYLSKPTWANHQAIFKNVGIEPVDYPYYDPKTIGLDFNGFIGALQNAPTKSVFLLHACAHNPTGVDPTEEQWKAIADVMLAKKHYAFFDCAYQGFASGDLDRDAWAVRHFVERGVALLVCQSFAKNAGLYGERVGALHVVSSTKEAADRVRSQLSVLQRSEISNPPTYGARVVSLILNDAALFEEWKADVKTMAGRIIEMRAELHRLLTEELKTPGSWEHIVKQIGMFSFTGINAEQSRRLVEEEHIYLTANGRISMAGLNSRNISVVHYVIEAVMSETKAMQTERWMLPAMAADELRSLAEGAGTRAERPDARPHYTALPPPAVLPAVSPDVSPLYYTAPTSPYFTPPTSPLVGPRPANPPALHITIPADTDDVFPVVDPALDLALDDASLTTLDKIYLFSRSKAAFHRIYITHALPDLLHHVEPHDAIEYVLPLLDGLALDEDEQVKEALVAGLVAIIWWFFSHCHITSEDQETARASFALPTVSVQAFTPILGTLLLSPNPLVGGATRHVVVDLLLRLKDADDSEASTDNPQAQPAHSFFHRPQREMFRTELLQQVVIGMGRLDLDVEDQTPMQDVNDGRQSRRGSVSHDLEQQDRDHGAIASPREVDARSRSDFVNPYFPALPLQFSVSLPSPSTLSDPFTSSSSLHSQNITETRNRLSPRLSPSPPDPTSNLRHSPLRSASSSRPLSPPPEKISVSQGLANALGPRPTNHTDHTVYDIPQIIKNSDELQDEDEQAAVGRLSSMSLMAAVTASGTLGEETKEAFVQEVVRVGQDSVYWVRREASFALGALAKVVPEEVVICSLLPLFDTLRRDPVWHVRHSALFALPALLPRLPVKQRRSLALQTIFTLAADESPVVQSGVLETLGEVIYTFHEDEGGPPPEIVELFLGRRKGIQNRLQATELLCNVVDRPLICAFNYPAVALTLGRQRWNELRLVYLELTKDRTLKVRRTLAASVGELANIVGTEHAQRDLIGVWWDGIRCEEEDVRTRAVESLPQLMGVVGPEAGDGMVLGLKTVWDEGGFRSWREREGIALALVALGGRTGSLGRRVVVGLVRCALEDGVTAVREAGVQAVAGLWSLLDADTLETLRADLSNLSQSPVFKRRMTFIACQHALAAVVPVDNGFFIPLLPLADDPIDAVRIRLARLVASVSGPSHPLLLQLTLRLSRDPLPDVRAYVLHPDSHQPSERYSTFSRPPHPSHDPSRPLVSASSAAVPDSDGNILPADTDPSSDHSNVGHAVFSGISHTEGGGKASVSISPVPA